MTPADQPTRDRISRLGLHETLFVDAGAGSGKTTQLVSRIVHLVLHGPGGSPVPLSEIAAITFTEAAARELQNRVRVEFERRQAEAPPGSPEHERCRQAIEDADLAAITTLHGFARRLLAEHPVAAGLPLTVEIADEVRSELAAEDRWRRFVDRLHRDPGMDDLLRRCLLLDVALEPRGPGHATLKDVAAELDQAWDRLGPISTRQHPPLADVDPRPFVAAVDALEACLATCTDPDDKFATHVRDRLLPEMRGLLATDDPDDVVEAFGFEADWGRGRGGAKGNWGGEPAPKHLVDAVNDAHAHVRAAAIDDVLQRLLTVVCREVRQAAEERRRTGMLEFHDLLVLAADLLRNHPAARRSIGRSYRHLLLDEFQDTDPLQIELAVLIAGSVEGTATPGAWADVPVESGRLFFVGDPKQSIYRFRRADIDLYLRARDRYGADGSRCSLVTNFRTVEPVIDWVNDVFTGLIVETPGSQPAYEPLAAVRRPAHPDAHRPVLLGGPHEDARAAELRAAEAHDVAATIASIRDDPAAWPVEEDGAWRPARLDDVTVLIPTRTSLPYLREALDDADIPYRLDTGTLVYDTQEVRDLLAAMRAVADPADERAVVATLRSPLYACSDRELFRYHRNGGLWRTDRPIPPEVPTDDPVRAAIEDLREQHEKRWWSGPSDLLRSLIEDRHARLLAFAERRPADVWLRLRFLLDQARAFEESTDGSVRGFLDWAELQRSGTARVHEPVLPETDHDSVRIMTIHGSKGLEFPITVVSGMTTKPTANRRGVSVLWNGDVPEVRIGKGVATENHDHRADLEEAMGEHEKLRLLYVACTRARDHLVVSAHHKAGDGSHGNRIFDASDPSLVRNVPDAVPAPPTPALQPPLPVDDRDRWVADRTRLLRDRAAPAAVSATRIARDAAEADELADVDDDPVDDPATPLVRRRRGRAATAVGRAVHACLQFADFDDLDGLAALAASQAATEGLVDAEEVRRLAASALESGAVDLARTHRHHRELFVAAPVGDRTVEGYVDLLIETDDGLVVVDYKTDAVSVGEIDAAVRRYELQGASYALALEAATGTPVREVRFVFCRLDDAIERPVPDLAAARARVLAFLTPS